VRPPAAVGIVAAAVALGMYVCSSGTSTEPPEPSSAPTTGESPPAASTTPGPTSTAAGPPLPLPQGSAWGLDFPDPFVTTVDGVHHGYGTTSGRVEVQHLSSRTLTGWAGPIDVLPETPSWATPLSTWAPALLRRDDSNLLFFTAQVAGTDKHCISVADAASPDGPFVDAGDWPLLCPDDLGGAIDPSPFVEDDGTAYLLWKNDGVTLRRDSAIWSQRLSDDGRSLVGEPTQLIATDRRWEYPHVEAPSMVHVGGTYWLAYSGNWWNQAAYGIGLATCTSPTGPCDKPFDGPVITSRPGAQGPGGAEFFHDRDGRLLIAYHAWLGQPGYPGHRALHIAPVDVDADALGLRP
jgi:beta-xylosidase